MGLSATHRAALGAGMYIRLCTGKNKFCRILKLTSAFTVELNRGELRIMHSDYTAIAKDFVANNSHNVKKWLLLLITPSVENIQPTFVFLVKQDFLVYNVTT